MSLFKKIHDKVFEDEALVPPPPAPGAASRAPVIPQYTPPKTGEEPSEIKEHPAHDTPFFSQPIKDDSTSLSVPEMPQEPVQDIQEEPVQEIVKEDIPADLPISLPSEPEWEQPPTFHLVDGRVVAGPTSLALIAHTLSDEVFSHHVNNERNDFSTWIRDGLKDADLAQKVQNVRSADELASVLESHHGTQIPASEEPLPALAVAPSVKVLQESFDAITAQLERAQAAQETINKQQEDLEEREERLAAREKEFEQMLAAFESERQKTTEALAETARLRDELRKRHVELAELALSLDAEQSRVRATQALSHDVRSDTFSKVAAVPESSGPDVHAVLDVVERAHHALIDKRLSEARELYSEARELFYKASVPENDRRELYNLIRELYTDIELTRMG